MAMLGLSPPTRGNPNAIERGQRIRGSIPAHAGEPTLKAMVRVRLGVYPRPRGGTSKLPIFSQSPSGLSPPTRGNRANAPMASAPLRSIPAHAGEPPPPALAGVIAGVYPRPRGGTTSTPSPFGGGRGLSPPTRGNLRMRSEAAPARRSIPAHAGEPCVALWGFGYVKVYPRPRGGTLVLGDAWRHAGGLSPPTRGNPNAHARPTANN